MFDQGLKYDNPTEVIEKMKENIVNDANAENSSNGGKFSQSISKRKQHFIKDEKQDERPTVYDAFASMSPATSGKTSNSLDSLPVATLDRKAPLKQSLSSLTPPALAPGVKPGEKKKKKKKKADGESFVAHDSFSTR